VKALTARARIYCCIRGHVDFRHSVQAFDFLG